jgi:hypothetical protein
MASVYMPVYNKKIGAMKCILHFTIRKAVE